MKRIFLAMTSLALLVMCLYPIQIGAASVDYSGGLLDGETMRMTPWNKPGTPTSALTDNNEDTFEILAKWESSGSSTATDHAVKDFSSAVTVNTLRISATGPLQVIFFNASGNKIKIAGSEYLPVPEASTDGRLVTFPQTSGVRQAVLFNPSTSSTVTVKEFNLYNISPPTDSILLQAIAGDALVNLSWNAINDATGYNLQRATTTGGPYTTIQSNISVTEFIDTDVTNGVTYYYIVTAINSAGESEPSNEAVATPEAPVVPPVGGNRVLLTILLDTGFEKEYDLSAIEIEDFLSWFDQKDQGNGPARYAFEKDWNKGPFTKRTDYVIFDKILTFEISEYSIEN